MAQKMCHFLVLRCPKSVGSCELLRSFEDEEQAKAYKKEITFIVLICSAVIAKNQANILGATMMVLAAGVILNIYGMVAGYSVASAFKMNAARRRTLAIEIGMQNAGLGTVLASVHFADQPEVAIPAAVFVFVCIITASVMVEFWGRSRQDIQLT